MRKIIGIIFFCFCCCAAAMAQDEPENNDTLSLTDITTTDILQTLQTGKIKWTAVTTTTYQAKWCFFGKCADDNLGITHIVESCCTFGQWIRKLFGGGKGSTTTLTQNTDSGGGTSGTGGGGNSSNTGGGSGSIPPGPTTPPIGTTGGTTNTPPGYGTTPTNTFTTTITTPPPIKPATALDNGDMEGGEIKEDSTPVKIDCPPESNTSGDSLTAVLDSIEASPQMTDLRTNLASRKFEVGMSINFNPGNGKYYPYDYINNGQSKNVTLNLAQWTFAIVHTHPLKDSSGKKNTQSPSPLDYFFVTDSWNSYPTHRFKTNYVVAGNGNDYAVTIGDTSNINLFLQNNNPNLLFDESTGTWKGSKTDKKSVYFKFYKYFKSLKEQGYNDEIANEYANIIMATDYNMGIKFYKKINGKFREQKFETVEETGETKYVLIICNN